MREFLANNYSLLTSIVEIIAALAAIMVYKKYKGTNVVYFLYFLIYVALLEIIGGYPEIIAGYESLRPVKEFLKGTWAEQNYWYYNIFWNIVGALFYSYYFMITIETKAYKNVIRVLRIVFIVCAVGYIFMYPHKLFENKIVFNAVLGSFLILISIVLYFIEVLRSELVLSFYKSINFYIASILFIWYLVITPIVFFNIYFSSKDWDFVLLRWEVYLLMNTFMYISFAFALFWCEPEKKIN